jgi:hypothetical protein
MIIKVTFFTEVRLDRDWSEIQFESFDTVEQARDKIAERQRLPNNELQYRVIKVTREVVQ